MRKELKCLQFELKWQRLIEFHSFLGNCKSDFSVNSSKIAKRVSDNLQNMFDFTEKSRENTLFLDFSKALKIISFENPRKPLLK